ncbi:hypothetical protein PVAG01_04386 [Phlyctema vagabunda]|uniref:DUF7918 domain-containing protein n=1 Tax=Phlyctema vagabunda TaxID=108571 RepID=A0ABR4PP92_9HELO
MAKHPFLSNITAQVCVAGIALQEHPDPDHDILSPPASAEDDAAQHCHRFTVSNYVCVQDSQDFSIRVAFDKKHYMDHSKVNIECYLDDKPAAHRSLERRPFQKSKKNWIFNIDEVQSWEKGQRNTHGMKLTFSKLNITSITAAPADIKWLSKQLGSSGLIEIRLYWGTYGKKGGVSPANVDEFKGLTRPIPEAANKGGDAKSHSTILGAPKRTKRISVVKESRKIQGEDHPLVIFRFFYRSKAFIQWISAETGRAGSQTRPVGIKRERIDHSSKRIIYELEDDDDGVEGGLREVKREREVEDLTEEPMAKRSKTQVIDLTEDDEGEESLFVD